MYRAIVITVSDRCYRSERPDGSGPAAMELLQQAGYEVIRAVVLPDERKELEAELRKIADGWEADLVITTGGTGFGPRDITPEATIAVCGRMVPGIPEAIRAASLNATPWAMLSRAQAGIREATLIVNLPGSPKAVRECLPAILPAIPHGIALLTGDTPDDE